MDPSAPETLFRVFISAPDDVAAERALAAEICAEIAREFGGRLGFALSGGGVGPELQENRPSTCDLVICILWKGLGETRPASFDRTDGTARTGIEFEFEDALESALRRHAPDILVYKKRVLIDAEQAESTTSGLRALNAFWHKWFRDEHGHFTASFDGFDAADELGEKLRRHLRQWLLRRRQDVTWPVELKGSPYRSLEPFEAEHAGVFFGRRHAVRQVVSKLAAAAARGCGFLVVLGGSGTGKSSLVRAGVMPWLTEHGIVPDVAVWRQAIVRPAALGEDALLGLAEALFAEPALPELAKSDYPSPERFAQVAARSAEAAAILVSGVLRGMHPTREARLILLVDQLEELLAKPAELRDGVVALLEAMALSGRVWVIATLRSDRYPEFQACPGLLRLKDAGASFDLLPPDQAEIRDIIEGPARAAGLVLEETSERSLAMLLEDASRERGALPLLQFMLHRLFLHRDIAKEMLLLSVYDRLGGLVGAIAGEAEQTLAALSPSLQAALPHLLINLVAVEDGKEAASARLLRRSDIADPDVQALAVRLIEGRFLVLDGSGPDATLRLAHEALLTHWPRLADLVRDHRNFLAIRSRLGVDAANWAAKGRDPDFLLPSGRRLAEAAEAQASHPTDLDAETIAYVRTSLDAEREHVAEQERAAQLALHARAEAAEARALATRRLVQRTRAAAVVVGILLVATIVAAAQWLTQRQLATARAAEAEKNYATALKAASDSVTLVAQARQSGQLPNDVAGDLLDATRQTFDQLGGSRQSPEVTAIRAELFNQMAQAAYQAGKFTDAFDALTKGLALSNELAASEPDNEKWQWAVARAHESLGLWSEQGGDLPAADGHYREMSAIADRMLAKSPDNQAWLNWKSEAMTHRAGTLQAEGDLPQAVSFYRDALAHFTAAATAKATAFDQYLVATTRLGLARALSDQGDIVGAIEQRRAALESFKLLGDQEKSNQNWQFLTALADAELGDGLRIKGELRDAYEALQEAIQVEQPLSNADQGNYLLRNNLVAAKRGMADVLLDRSQTEKALKLYRSVLETIGRLAEHDPANSFWQRNLGQMHGRVGDMLADARDLSGAEQEYRSSLDITGRLATKDPTNVSWQRELSLAHARLGDLLHAKGDDAGALAEERERLAILQRLTAKDPSNAPWQRDLAAAHGRLGLLLAAHGDSAEAQAEFAACAALPRAAFDTDVEYNRHEDMHDVCDKEAAGSQK